MRRHVLVPALAVAMLPAMQWSAAHAQLAAPQLGAPRPAAASPVQRQPAPPAAAQPTTSGQPVPRFVSLKSDRVNVRRGPGPEHGIDWVFRRAGLPVEVIAESEVWRRVRDSEGSTGWVLASLLSSRRTALVEPWEVKPNVPPSQVALKDPPK